MPAPSVRLDPSAKLRHLLQTWAFCVVVAGLQVAFDPGRPPGPPLAYSLCIGTLTWAVIDLGRHFFPSARETGWPAFVPAMLLVASGILGGYVVGSAIADALCRSFGWYGAAGPRGADARVALLISVLAGLAGTYYFYSVHRGRWLQERVGEAQRHADEARLKLLEAQLEPHLLFNTLANLRALIAVDPPRAQRMLDHVIAFLRSTLDASRSATHPLEREFARLGDYLELMAIRMGPRLAYELDLPPSAAAVPVPTLLLQPLVENAIQHGLEPRVEGGRIRVSARRQPDALVLEVLDTGAGPGDTVRGSGFGLQQVRERLAAAYGPRARLELQAAKPAGTLATIRLPLDP